MRKRVLSLVSIVLSFIAAAAIFQNCGKFSEGSGASAGVPIYYNEAVAGTPLSALSASAAGFATIDPTYRAGTLDNSCLQKAATSTYDACLFWKNPLATSVQMNSPLQDPPPADVLPDLTVQGEQVFGVRLSAIVTAGVLKNSFFDVYYTDAGGLPQHLPITGNRWTSTYVQGHSANAAYNERFAIEQIQAFYNLNLFQTMMAGDGGRYYPTGTIGINAVSVDMGYNVAYDPVTNIVFSGVRGGQDGRFYPLSANSDLLVREVAHANFLAANPTMVQANKSAVYILNCQPSHPYFLTDSSNLISSEGDVLNTMQAVCGHTQITSPNAVEYCATDAGCWRALDNGVSDFFTYAAFAKWPSIGELALTFDNIRYWKKRSNISRSNATKLLGVTYYDDFARRMIAVGPDAKRMGEVFSDILFDIYADNGTDRAAYLKTVNQFLPQITAASTFLDAKQILTSVDNANFAGRNGAIIKSYFEKRGY